MYLRASVCLSACILFTHTVVFSGGGGGGMMAVALSSWIVDGKRDSWLVTLICRVHVVTV